MADITYRANITTDIFPLLSELQGPNVIRPGLDQHYISSPFGDNRPAVDRGIPEVLYLQNAVPTAHGYKSVAYEEVVPASLDGRKFIDIFEIKDFDGNRGFLGITEEGYTYIINRDNPVWYDVTPGGPTPGVSVTVANATGSSFICYANTEIYQVDIAARTLSVAAIQWDSPRENSDIVGIASSNNYLLAHDGTYVYWSSALDVLDFQESQITGAGSGVPVGATGRIVMIAPLGIGFAIYCQGNIIVGVYSGNVQFPWLFKEAPNGSGISEVKNISLKGDESSNYAWASSGLLKVTLSGCSNIFPQVSDFLGGRLLETYDSNTDVLSTVNLSVNPIVRIYYISNRFLCISYGLTSLEYNYILLYDTALKRWGKLKINHMQLVDLPFTFDSASSSITFNDLASTSFESLADTSFESMYVAGSETAEAKHAFGIMTKEGTIYLVNTEYSDNDAEGVLMLGKYAVDRSSFSSVTKTDLEVVKSDNNNFSLHVLSSLDGKTFTKKQAGYLYIDSPAKREFLNMATGQNHVILIKGSFHITSVVLTLAIEGSEDG